MKKLLLSVFCGLLFAACSAPHAVVKGTINGLTDQRVVVNYVPVAKIAEGGAVSDTVTLIDGSFEFLPLSDTTTTMVCIYPLESVLLYNGGEDYYDPKECQLIFIVASGEKIVFNARLTEQEIMDYRVEKGSELNRQLADYASEVSEYRNRMTLALKPIFVEHLTEQQQQQQSAEYRKSTAEFLSFQKEYVSSHSDDELAVWLTGQLSFNDMSSLMPQLAEVAERSVLKPYYDSVMNRIEMAKKAEELTEKYKDLAVVGKPAPDFTLLDTEGNEFSLSSLRGKWTIVDFWGSWCGSCLKGMPELKSAYEKYAGKVEVVGVACNDTDENWRNAIDKYSLDWINVFCPNDMPMESYTPLVYNISAYPTKLLVDPDGIVRVRLIEEDDSFYQALGNLVK